MVDIIRPAAQSPGMIKVRKTEAFATWFNALRDPQAKVRVQVRIDRLAFGNPGQHRVLKGGVCEMKIDYGSGYRVYYTDRGDVLVVLLCGGDKRTQARDIAAATALVHALET